MKYFIIVIISGLLLGCGSTARFGSYGSESESSGKENIVLETVTGTASYYAHEFHGRKTANGETYNMNDLTAAHRSFPFNTIVRVTNLSNGKSVELRINDRMPSFKGRIIDISLKAAKVIDMLTSGITEVKVEVLKWGN
jgi:rare lipoprotein A